MNRENFTVDQSGLDILLIMIDSASINTVESVSS